MAPCFQVTILIKNLKRVTYLRNHYEVESSEVGNLLRLLSQTINWDKVDNFEVDSVMTDTWSSPALLE